MIRYLTQKLRSLRSFIFLAVFFSSLIVFIGVSGISSLLYENLMADQTQHLAEQLAEQQPEPAIQLDLPSVTSEVRITYILTFIFFSCFFLLAAVVFSHFAIRRINQSLEMFNNQIRHIQSSSDLKRFNPGELNFVFNELNQAFASVNSLARQLEAVLVDKSALEVKADLLSKLIINNSEMHDWNAYVREVFADISQVLPFDYVTVVFAEEQQVELNTFWLKEPDQQTEKKAMDLLDKHLKLHQSKAMENLPPRLCHYLLPGSSVTDIQPDDQHLAQLLLQKPQVGGILGLFIHSTVMDDPNLRPCMDSILIVLLNLLGASRAISGYTQQLVQAISQSDQENAMAADILYGHMLVKNADRLPGINHQIRSSNRFSGDIVLIKRSPSGSIFILLADATGHGLSATITIMPVITVFEAMVQKGHQLPFILSEMNKRLLKDLPDDRFVAAILIEVDPIRGEISIWNGAMPPALWINNKGKVTHESRSRNMALGILDEALFDGTPERHPLPESGYLLSCSDGLLEQTDSKGHLFGMEQVLRYLSELTAQECIPELIRRVESHAGQPDPDDDASLCQIDFTQLERHANQETPLELLRKGLTSPFEWQMKIYGEQLTRQALPTLCHEFMQTLGLDMQLRRRVFAITHELTQKMLDLNLLKLPVDPLQMPTTNHRLSDYYQMKRQALEQLNKDMYLQLSLRAIMQEPAPYLVIEVSDNATGVSRLTEQDNLRALITLSDQLECLQQGHHIRVRLG
ncbi:MAG: serine/threonine-protein phosphatase [Marinospirillum sp.]|uniref:PP2C family protein-serine/threonine phosphatase n=1 Tax=Marinospirillum sp. TaxID=2183934 RepID=UPI0019F83575|nr:PP2C family protein-serine/threonine phosphatase [Marinospirillum sp.]MBE0505576.1 serine/threonine-protein phosphatase [Marinospirillum sp.]